MHSIRLRQWLLLLLRTAAIASIVIAFSRPAVTSGKWFGSSSPVAAAILLDASYSTTFRSASVSLFDRLRNQARELLEIFASADYVSVIPFWSKASVVNLTFEQQAEAIQEYGARQEGTNLEVALQAAEHHFQDFPNLQHELFICSDVAAPGWSNVRQRQSGIWRNTAIYITDLEVENRANCYVQEVKSSNWLTSLGNIWRIHATIVNNSDQSVDELSANLFIDGERVQRKIINLSPDEHKTVEFTTIPSRTGSVNGYVQIDEDALKLDDRRYFTATIPKQIRILSVGDSEDLYFIRQALEASATKDPTLALQFSSLNGMNEAKLLQSDILLLCNLAVLSREQATRVRNFVSGGGSVIIFPSAQTDISQLNRYLFPGLLPTSIKGIVGHPTIVPFPASSPQVVEPLHRLDFSRVDHFLFEGLNEALSQLRFFAFFDLVNSENVSPLLTFLDGSIAAVISWHHRGRAVLFAVPISLDWSQLPSSAAFVPLIHRLCRFLNATADLDLGNVVGQTVRRRLHGVDIDDFIAVRQPDGKRFRQKPEGTAEGIYWKGRTSEAGVWLIEKGGEIIDRFAVNVDTRESNLRKVPSKTIERVFGPQRVIELKENKELREQILTRRYGREWWQEFVIFALVLLLLELWVGRGHNN